MKRTHPYNLDLPYEIYLDGYLWGRLVNLNGITVEHIPAPNAALNRVEVYHEGKRVRHILVTNHRIEEELDLEEE
jgi:hypothetical protein